LGDLRGMHHQTPNTSQRGSTVSVRLCLLTAQCVLVCVSVCLRFCPCYLSLSLFVILSPVLILLLCVYFSVSATLSLSLFCLHSSLPTKLIPATGPLLVPKPQVLCRFDGTSSVGPSSLPPSNSLPPSPHCLSHTPDEARPGPLPPAVSSARSPMPFTTMAPFPQISCLSSGNVTASAQGSPLPDTPRAPLHQQHPSPLSQTGRCFVWLGSHYVPAHSTCL
jgi:hypothetical protein